MTEYFGDNVLIGVLASSLTSVVTWVLAKRKYNTEVNANEIQNLKDSLDFYKQVLEENQKLLKSYMDKVDEGMLEIHNLRKAVSELLSVSCVDQVCKKRKMIDDEDAKKFLRVKTDE